MHSGRRRLGDADTAPSSAATRGEETPQRRGFGKAPPANTVHTTRPSVSRRSICWLRQYLLSVNAFCRAPRLRIWTARRKAGEDAAINPCCYKRRCVVRR